MPKKNEKQLESARGETLEELWRKGFVEKMSFEPGVEERSSNG